MKILKAILSTTLVVLFSFGCGQKPLKLKDQDSKVKTNNFRADDIKNLQSKIAALKSKIDEIAYGQHSDEWILLRPEEHGYQPINTTIGKILIETEDVQPFMDGYKVFLKAGNPTSATLSGIKLIYLSITTNSLIATNDIPIEFQHGTWTHFDFILAPSTIEQVRNTWISIKTDKLVLEDYSNQNKK